MLTALNSASMPSGGHTSVTKWLNKAASTEIPFLVYIVKVRVVFDNEQVITLVLIAGFRAGLAGLNLGYPENPAFKPRKPS